MTARLPTTRLCTFCCRGLAGCCKPGTFKLSRPVDARGCTQHERLRTARMLPTSQFLYQSAGTKRQPRHSRMQAVTPSRIPPSACDPRRPVCEGSDPPVTIMTDDHIQAVRCAWTELTHDGAESFEEVCCHILWRSPCPGLPGPLRGLRLCTKRCSPTCSMISG